jgi:predicted ATPase with chaperone activity
VLRTAWSIADLNGRKKPSREDVVMAYQLRGGISHLIGAA